VVAEEISPAGQRAWGGGWRVESGGPPLPADISGFEPAA